MREARWEQRDPDKEIAAQVREPSAVRKSRPENPDVKSKTKAQRQVCRSLLSKSNEFTAARSDLLPQRKQNQNKHLFAPPPRRFLNYRVGPRGAAHARQGAALPLVPNYVGKISAAATTIADTNQSKELRGSLMTPAGQSETSACPPVPSVSNFKVGTLFPSLSSC